MEMGVTEGPMVGLLLERLLGKRLDRDKRGRGRVYKSGH